MTPFDAAGYLPEDVFQLTEEGGLIRTFQLSNDDGTDHPAFVEITLGARAAGPVYIHVNALTRQPRADEDVSENTPAIEALEVEMLRRDMHRANQLIWTLGTELSAQRQTIKDLEFRVLSMSHGNADPAPGIPV